MGSFLNDHMDKVSRHPSTQASINIRTMLSVSVQPPDEVPEFHTAPERSAQVGGVKRIAQRLHDLLAPMEGLSEKMLGERLAFS